MEGEEENEGEDDAFESKDGETCSGVLEIREENEVTDFIDFLGMDEIICICCESHKIVTQVLKNLSQPKE